MSLKKYSVIVSLLLGFSSSYAADEQKEYSIYFKTGSSAYDPGYQNNAETINEIKQLFEDAKADNSFKIIGITFGGYTSLEGSYQINEKLAADRRATIEKIVKELSDYPANITVTQLPSKESYINWQELKGWVADSKIFDRDKIIKVIDQPHVLVMFKPDQTIDSRIIDLQNLDGGAAWLNLKDYFADMRKATATIEFSKNSVRQPQVQEVPVVKPEPIAPVEDETVVEEVVDVEQFTISSDEWRRKIYIKSNAVGWILSNANIAGEIDICRHLSFALPIYYSAVNYFTSKIKFRTFSIQPEFRYWVLPDNDKFFIGAHFGMSYFNMAFNGKFRYQDHDGKSPALGGGLSVGYRFPISKNKLWKMEVSVGAGAYKVKYDKFENVANGPLVGTSSKTYFGLDQVSVAFSYTFKLK